MPTLNKSIRSILILLNIFLALTAFGGGIQLLIWHGHSYHRHHAGRLVPGTAVGTFARAAIVTSPECEHEKFHPLTGNTRYTIL